MTGLMLGAAAGAAAVFAGYSSMAPRSQAFGRTFLGAAPGSRQLALTYDDGPNDPHTLRLLEVLARHDVRATFFLIGWFVAQRPDIARQIAAAGHVIGNHTFTHPNLIFASRAKVRKELEYCRQALTDAVGEHSNLFRPPFGGRRPGVLGEVRRQGLTPVMWSASAWDWRRTTADAVERRVVEQVRGGEVVLMHDGGHRRMGADRAHTVEATDRLIRRYQGEGFALVTVPEMMGRQVK